MAPRTRTVDESGKAVQTKRAPQLVQANRADVQEAAEALIMQLPELPDSDGMGIYAAMLNAEDWEDLGVQSKLPAGKDLVGVEMKIVDVYRKISDLEDTEEDSTGVKLSHFLVIDALIENDTKDLRWQTSAAGLAFPITKLAVWGKLPAKITIQESDKTRRGFKPLNVKIHYVTS